MQCPKCQSTVKQYRSGFNLSGSQRHRCGVCNRVYTPIPNLNGYPPEIRMLAIRMYVEGNSQRAIGRILKVSQQSVANWINAYVEKLPPAERPEKLNIAELDEMYTFIGDKKQNLHPNYRGSRDTVRSKLGYYWKTYPREHASLSGSSSWRKAILQ